MKLLIRLMNLLALLIISGSSIVILCADDLRQHQNNNNDENNNISEDFSSSFMNTIIMRDDETIPPEDNNNMTSLESLLRDKKSHHEKGNYSLSSGNSCSSHKDCEECTSSSWDCHWCTHDNACHARGSWSGCFNGATCNSTKPPHENTTCSSHQTCSECSLSSHWGVCHWCAHDNACHIVGSMYGCVSGVDCYSNNRCQRLKPKYLNDGWFYSISDIGFLPTIIIVALGLTLCCCSTILFNITNGVKGAFDDNRVSAAEVVVPPQPGDGDTLTQQQQSTTREEPENDNNNNLDTSSSEVIPLVQQQSNNNQPATEKETATRNDIAEEAASLENYMGEDDDEEMVQEGYRLLTDNTASAPTSSTPIRRGADYVQSVFSVCRFCFVLSLIAIVAAVALTFRYFPQEPTYNLCNDNLAWKSIVTGMTKFQASADFQLLLSIQNPNRFEISVDMGSGEFKHKGVYVGNFDIPPTKAPARSIIDVLVIAHFTPGVWNTLSLTKEYYDGSLAFDVYTKATCRTPILLNYSFSMDFTYLHLLVDDPLLDDRQLCACPTWDDQKNKTEELILF